MTTRHQEAAILARDAESVDASRRSLLQLAGAGLAASALGGTRLAHGQVPEESSTEALTLQRKGIDRELQVINIDLLEADAKKVYTDAVYAFVVNGSGKNWTLRENQRAWGDWSFNPHRMRGIVRTKIDTSVTLLGTKLPHPILVTPFGSHSLHHPAGEVATAQGAAKSGALLSVSSASTRSMEEIAAASKGPKWFQMYLNVDEGLSREVLKRVKAAGFNAVIHTIVAIGQGSSDEYIRHNRARPWLPYGNFKEGGSKANAFKTDLSWKDTEMIRKVTGLPVVVKGITRPEDAVAAISAGAAAIQVSNHGGRALDGTPASITVLPAIADAVKGKVPIILDSGIRRGTDIVKSLALGANAVAIGRPVMYGLTLGGASGVDSVIKFMHREMVDTLLHCGVNRPSELTRSHVARAWGSVQEPR
jgi:lactate oxidase